VNAALGNYVNDNPLNLGNSMNADSCDDCVEADKEYMRSYKTGQPALSAVPTTDPTTTPPEPGAVQKAVMAELEGSPTATPLRQSLSALAVALAKDLDNSRLAASHSALSKELRAVLDSLRENTVGSTKLALISQKSRH
jgi:hypothetical protein